MNLQPYYDFSARHLLTQNVQCMIGSKCTCQSGTLRCAQACFAVESDVTIYGQRNGDIHSLRIFGATQDSDYFLDNFVDIHDKSKPSEWPDKLNELAIEFKLQPFGVSDLSSGRGIVNPLAVWYTNTTERAKLLEAHATAGTSHLLADYLAAWPVDTSGVRESVLPTESQGVV